MYISYILQIYQYNINIYFELVLDHVIYIYIYIIHEVR
jgi:hypothetical protein